MADLFSRLRALAKADMPLDQAERLLRADERRRKPALTSGERHAAEKRERAEQLGLAETREAAQDARLTAWMGYDIAPPPDIDD